MMETKKRLFVAIPLPEVILQKLEEAQGNFRRFARDAKWVKMQSVHLTLRFLGYVDPARIPSIKDALAAASTLMSSHNIIVKGCGFFPSSRKPSVFWAGVDSEQLIAAQLRIEDAMNTLGFQKEERAFSPHLTLARFRDRHGLMHLVEEARKYESAVFGEFTARSLLLFESILHREGAEYIELAEFRFHQ